MAKSPNSLYQRLGDISLPLVAGDLTSGVFPDPPRDNLLALFSAAINDELGDAWPTAATETPLAGKSPVEQTLPLAPSSSVLRQWKADFPLLALHRFGEPSYEERTLQHEQRTQQWLLHYMLGALSVANLHKLEGALIYAASIVQLVIRNQGHAAYESGAVQFGTGKGGLSSLRIVSHEAGAATFAEEDDSPQYLAVTVTLESTEVDAFVDGAFAPMQGADFDFGVGTSGDVINSLIQASGSVPLQYG